MRRLNERHLRSAGRRPQLEARIQSFELAYRMQSEAADAFDVSREPQTVRETLRPRHARPGNCSSPGGCSSAACGSSRSGAAAASRGTTTTTSRSQHRKLAGEWDRPIAAFLTDLKQRGLLDETLVIWGGEFGRTPVAELPGA